LRIVLRKKGVSGKKYRLLPAEGVPVFSFPAWVVGLKKGVCGIV
jgi:hypothetical protein